VANLRRPIVALMGNPNTGKSTVFNALTGLKQHTGNWPGKTVLRATGTFGWLNTTFTIIDLPGTYSLFPNSPDEEIARDFVLFHGPDVTVIVADACSLERNLNLALQVLEITPRAVLCVNLMDEARRRKITVDIPLLASELGIPAIPCVARTGEGLSALKNAILHVATSYTNTSFYPIKYSPGLEIRLQAVTQQLAPLGTRFPPRWLALRLLERDEKLWQLILTNQEEQIARDVAATSRFIKPIMPWLS
jgi:Fe2+ transport system protein B